MKLLPTLLAALLAASAAQAQTYTVLCSKVACGQLKLAESPGRLEVDYSYRNNGRGPDQKEAMTFAPDGAWLSYRTEGVSTYGARIAESFERQADGRAVWRSPVDSGERPGAAREAVYLPVQASPAWLARVAQSLLADKATRIEALPVGRLSIERVQQLSLPGQPYQIGLYAVDGLDLEPSYLWLREDNHALFAQVYPGWGGTLLQGFEGEADRLSDVQKRAQLARLQRLARELPQPLPGLTLIEGVRWFDAQAGVLRGPSDVYLYQGRISAIAKPGSFANAAPAQRIAGRGRTLLPGLVDMHAHLGAGELLLNLAAGVTAVRDVGNSNAELAELRGRVERGEVLGPNIAANGFIEGKSPFSSQADFVADSLPEALAAIDWYAAHGYRQLKLYNSIRPEWVKPMVAHARELGLRTGGHVPAFMTARQAVEAGFDEVHHINQITLNFLVSKTDDTRTLLRFNLVGDKAADLKLNDARTRDFIALLKKHGTVVDPTMTAFEAQYTQRQGQPDPSYAMVAANLPAVVQRGFLSAEVDMDDAKARRWGASWKVMMDLLRRMHAAGVPLVSGTDATAGFALQRELELYVQAGIPAAQALKIATWNGAKYSDRLGDIGSIERGKRADLLLVDGDPVADIRAIRRVALVFQGRNGQTQALSPAVLYQSMGILPFVPAAEIVK
ncbi:amidohydrolase family protein [Roseateles saccharophilus]|uniref:Amidohydrolase family protein n=1 Tax=Roseateles saccharophilus TaxID=304 RepID=A0A4R3UJZ5_ROSSA|nr:amidohydrolase family protein [Roseateles saccharophilus]TCU89687.1 amidohydrolase family protein [Roseateles saccharophilus]